MKRDWQSLSGKVDSEPDTTEVRGPDGICYQIEVQFFWDSKPGQDIRVMVAVDDGGWRACVPLTRDDIKPRRS